MRKKVGEYSYDQTILLGKGTFGSVYLGQHHKTHQKVAVKLICLQHLDPNKKRRLLDNFRNEVTNMQLAEGQNIVQLLAVHASERNLYLVCQYCQQGGLDHSIQKEKRLSESQAIRIFHDIVKGFKCLHQSNIVHRDLKPANILMHKGIAKVGDFGFSKMIDSHEQLLKSLVGTPQYMSPQILMNCEYTEKTDIWSLGIILYEMLFGRLPWERTTNYETLVTYISNCTDVRVPEVPRVSDCTRELLVRMLKIKEADRISWKELFDIESSRTHQEQTIESERSVSPNNSELLKETSLSYAKSYFLSNRVVLDAKDLLDKSASNDIIKTILSNGENSIRIQTEQIFERHASESSQAEVNKVLSQRNYAVLLVSIYFKLTDLVESGGLQPNAGQIALRLLLLKQAFLFLFAIYKSLKQSHTQTGINNPTLKGVSWQSIRASEYQSSLQTLASIDNTMCSMIFNNLLKSFHGSHGHAQILDLGDADLSKVASLANNSFDSSGITQHLLKKYMWYVLLRIPKDAPTQVLKLGTLMGIHLKRLSRSSDPTALNKEFIRLYEFVETSTSQTLKRSFEDIENTIE